MEHRISGLEYHLKSIAWTHFGTLTLRQVPPLYILNRCVFEYLNRIIKRFCISNKLNWGSSWIVRYEYGEKGGRLHVHFLFMSDKPHANVVTQCKIMEHMWEVETASRWVNRLNQEQRDHNVKLRKKYRFKSDAQFEQDHGDELRLVTRNDFSAPGFAKVRVYDHHLKGVEYIMKDADIPLNGANRYELAKFNDVMRDDVTLMASHRLLFDIFNKSGDVGYSARAGFLKGLEASTQTGRYKPLHDGTRVPQRGRSRIKTPNRSKQFFDSQPEYLEESWSWLESSY